MARSVGFVRKARTRNNVSVSQVSLFGVSQRANMVSSTPSEYMGSSVAADLQISPQITPGSILKYNPQRTPAITKMPRFFQDLIDDLEDLFVPLDSLAPDNLGCSICADDYSNRHQPFKLGCGQYVGTQHRLQICPMF